MISRLIKIARFKIQEDFQLKFQYATKLNHIGHLQHHFLRIFSPRSQSNNHLSCHDQINTFTIKGLFYLNPYHNLIIQRSITTSKLPLNCENIHNTLIQHIQRNLITTILSFVDQLIVTSKITSSLRSTRMIIQQPQFLISAYLKLDFSPKFQFLKLKFLIKSTTISSNTPADHHHH